MTQPIPKVPACWDRLTNCTCRLLGGAASTSGYPGQAASFPGEAKYPGQGGAEASSSKYEAKQLEGRYRHQHQPGDRDLGLVCRPVH